jgi:hypothetical protein
MTGRMSSRQWSVGYILISMLHLGLREERSLAFKQGESEREDASLGEVMSIEAPHCGRPKVVDRYSRKSMDLWS